jgi:(2Fe-2S) ferredoxin
MDPVLVTARRSVALDKIGFGQRKKFGMGHFIGPEQIERTHPFVVTDIFRQVPGLRVVPGEFGDIVTSSRAMGGCVDYYLDGVPYQEMTPGDISSFVNANEIAAVEVYQDGIAPPQFQRGLSNCATIVLWTRFKVGS